MNDYLSTQMKAVTKTLAPYDPTRVVKIKTIPGHKWHPDKKHWSFPNTEGTLEKILNAFEGEEIHIDPALQAKLHKTPASYCEAKPPCLSLRGRLDRSSLQIRSEQSQFLKSIEGRRKSKLLVYITGDRRGLETKIATDAFPIFHRHLIQMLVQLDIKDEIVASMKIPLPEVEKELTKELAFALYARWALSMGKARHMAGLTKREFYGVMRRT